MMPETATSVVPLPTVLSLKVQHHHITRRQRIYHLRTWITLPGLYHPHRILIISLHSPHYRRTRSL